MKTTIKGFGRQPVGSGPFTTAQSARRGVWTALAVIAVYLVLAAFYVMGLAG